MRRILLGLVMMAFFITVAQKASFLLELGVHHSLLTAAIALLGAGLGGYLARSRFLVPALVMHALLWAVAFYFVYQIAQLTGHGSLLALLQQNAPGFFLSLLGVSCGALIGQALARRRQPNNSSKPTPLRGAA
ncbi:hypothetical protein ACFFGH_34015 [Lysobacter korlensis]|uniref:TIGR04086 family membrane protein n=1 Tax=Lysobacter korlensis TaxID=553636 RepID=A0ABV6S1E6_9GAMM